MSDRSVIVIDGSSAMSEEVQREFRFRLLPIHVLFGDEDFTPGVNMTTADYYEKLASSKKPPTTAAPSLGECVEIYRALVAEGFRSILVITVINEASVTHTVAKTAAQQVDGAKIEVVDSRTTAGGITLIGTACARILRDGRGFDEAVAMARRLAGRVQILALIDTLEYLRRGGRVSGAQAAFGDGPRAQRSQANSPGEGDLKGPGNIGQVGRKAGQAEELDLIQSIDAALGGIAL